MFTDAQKRKMIDMAREQDDDKAGRYAELAGKYKTLAMLMADVLEADLEAVA